MRRVEERGVERVGRKQKAYNNQAQDTRETRSQVIDTSISG